jgi:hypothetical protein
MSLDKYNEIFKGFLAKIKKSKNLEEKLPEMSLDKYNEIFKKKISKISLCLKIINLDQVN